MANKDYKDVNGKLPMELIEPVALETLAEVLKYGLDKYGHENGTSYQHGEIDTYIGSLMRHLTAYMRDEHLDPESGISHLKHLFFNAYVLIYLDEKGKKRRGPSEYPFK